MFRKTNIFVVPLLLVGCQTQQFYKEVKNGDILFIEAKNENLSGAISRVTKSANAEISYDHTAIIEVLGNKKNILHASGENGSEKLDLKLFIKKNRKQRQAISLYRLKSEYQNCTEKALQKANAMLGKPYNTLYIPSEEAYYCSDFVERAFRDCQIFQLNPMTFINPETGKTDDYWQKLYQKHNAEIPEGQLGCNPNGISKSEKINKVKTLK